MSWRTRSIVFLLLALACYGLAVSLSHREFVAHVVDQSHGLGAGPLICIGAGTGFLVMGARKPRAR